MQDLTPAPGISLVGVESSRRGASEPSGPAAPTTHAPGLDPREWHRWAGRCTGRAHPVPTATRLVIRAAQTPQTAFESFEGGLSGTNHQFLPPAGPRSPPLSAKHDGPRVHEYSSAWRPSSTAARGRAIRIGRHDPAQPQAEPSGAEQISELPDAREVVDRIVGLGVMAGITQPKGSGGVGRPFLCWAETRQPGRAANATRPCVQSRGEL